MDNMNISPDKISGILKQNQSLKKLAEITRAINATLDIGKLLTIVMEAIKDIMDADASSLLLYEEDSEDLVFKVALGEAGSKLSEKYRIKKGVGIAGWVAEQQQALVINDVYSDKRFNPEFDKKTGFVTRAIICAPLLFKGKMLGVIQAINPLKKELFDDEDLQLFLAFADQAVMAVQNAILFERAVEEKVLQEELKSAQNIHKKLKPVVSLEKKNLSFAARSLSASNMGGEFYEFFDFPDRLTLTLGDVHQHGIAGGLTSSMISGAIKMLACCYDKSAVTYVKKLREFISSNIKTFDEISFFLGIFSPVDNIFQFVNTGFAYPIIIRNKKARYLKFNSHSLRNNSGDEEKPLPKKVRVHLKPGDTILIVTDGLLSLRNSSRKRLGLKRIMDKAQEFSGSPEEIIESLMTEAKEFNSANDIPEDITIICCKVN